MRFLERVFWPSCVVLLASSYLMVAVSDWFLLSFAAGVTGVLIGMALAWR